MKQAISIKKQFYVELRTIDTPGQLNAVCKVLKELWFNIDELKLKPMPPEFERQTTITLLISRRAPQHTEHLKTTLIELETALNTLIGVRAFSIVRQHN
jgi:glycine cleavage system regulatory protein